MPVLNNPYRGNPRLVRRWQLPLDDTVITLAWSPDGTAVAAALVSGPITVVEAATGKVRWSAPGHAMGTADLSWRYDGLLLATAGLDGKARLWDGTTGEAGAVFDAGATWAEHVLWHPTSDLLMTAAGKKLRAWSSSGEMLFALPDHRASIADIAWRPGISELTTATHGLVNLWKPPSLDPVKQLTRQGPILALAWSPDGQRLAHGNQDASVSYWILKTADELLMSGYPGKVSQVVWDPTGTFLATNGAEVVTVWNTTPPGPADSEPLTFTGHTGAVTTLAYQSAGPLLASGAGDGLIFLYQPGKFKKSIAKGIAGSPVTIITWAPDDRSLAVGTEAGLGVYFLA